MDGDGTSDLVQAGTEQQNTTIFIPFQGTLDGPLRHGELKRAIQGISQKMLTQTLRSMERDGLVQRTVIDVIPPHVEFTLTPLGRTLSEPLVAICRWAMDHLPEMQAARAANQAHAPA